MNWKNKTSAEVISQNCWEKISGLFKSWWITTEANPTHEIVGGDDHGPILKEIPMAALDPNELVTDVLTGKQTKLKDLEYVVDPETRKVVRQTTFSGEVVKSGKKKKDANPQV